MIADFIAAARSLWRARPFAAAAMLTLGIGIAGVALLLAFIQGVLLRPLPIRDQARVIIAWKQVPSADTAMPFGGSAIRHARDASRLLETVGGVTSHAVSPWTLVDQAGAGYVNGAIVTGSFFEVLGVNPIVGRVLTDADDGDGSERVIVISDRLWRRRYGASTGIVGTRITIDEQPVTIAGVIPPDNDYPRGVEVWRATGSVPISPTFGDAARQEINLVARLRRGVTIQQAAAEIAELTRGYEATQPPNRSRGLRPVVRSFEEVVVGDTRPVLIALLAAVVLVLLIACANVANLLLMRGEGRRAELAVRQALGAGRARLVRQLLAEGLVLTGLATIAALVVAVWSLQALVALMPEALPRRESIRIDGVVVQLIAGIALPVCALAAAGPAWLSAKVDIIGQLRANGRGATGARSRGRRLLVVAQVGLAVAVIAAAGVVTRSLLRLQAVDTGIASGQLWFVTLSMPQSQYADRARHSQFLSEAITALRSVPQFTAVTSVNTAPFAGGWSVPQLTVEGQSATEAATNPPLNLEAVRAGYFDTMGVRLVRGRGFTDMDGAGTVPVAIVSDEVARRVTGRDIVGRRVKMGAPDSRGRWLTVIGVAASTRYRDLAGPEATLYLPVAQFIDAAQTLAVRTLAPPALIASMARERIDAIDPSVHVMSVVPFADRIAVPLARPRFNALLLNLFGAVALLLAGIGQYAVIAAYVRQREREIAVRVALGASPANVRRLVLGEALVLAGTGVAIGLAAAMLASRLLQGLAYGVDTLDPVAVGGAVLLLFGVSIAASLLPVRRASRVDAIAELKA